MRDRVTSRALGVAARELQHEYRTGATWGDAHLVATGDRRAVVVVDSSRGFSEARHPQRGKSPAPATTIFVEVR